MANNTNVSHLTSGGFCILSSSLSSVLQTAPPRSFSTHSLQPQSRSLLSSMLPPRDLAYSLFGGPLILNVGPTINGEMVHVRVQPINTISVSALVISVLLFMGFMYIYLYPLCRQRRARVRATTSGLPRNSDAEQPSYSGMQIDEEKRSLLSWLHFRSRDRFSTHDSPDFGLASPPGLKRQPSSFARGSLIPSLSPITLSPPPPAYASRPSSPLTQIRGPSPLSSPRSEASTSPHTPAPSLPTPALTISTGRASATSRQFDPRHMPSPQTAQSRSPSGPAPSPTTLAVRSFMAPRSVSANTLHPVGSDLHISSRAKVYTTGETDGEASTITSPTRPSREGAGLGLGIGIGLAARGRILTRGPSWSPVGGSGVGRPF
ncbi:hypothetical protein B0H19DRAFT_456274 [Mycena capillaripes]|nr:hypothetical protein B0H19DRAFT_456274 [Mycena capillaripes]